MGYLLLPDYYTAIQKVPLDEMLGQGTISLATMTAKAQEEAITYLVQKYDTAKEFRDLTPWVYGSVRYGLDRVYLDAATYSASGTYTLNSLTLYSGNVYINTTPITVAEAFNSSKWTLLGPQYKMYFAKLPNAEWDYDTTYNATQIVFYNNKNYTCLVSNTGRAPSENPLYWGAGTSYSIASDVLISDATKWTSGDNRSSLLVSRCVDIALFNLTKRIAPTTAPTLREKAYDDAISWLKKCASGDDVIPNIPKIKPKNGARIRWGARRPKINNQF